MSRDKSSYSTIVFIVIGLVIGVVVGAAIGAFGFPRIEVVEKHVTTTVTDTVTKTTTETTTETVTTTEYRGYMVRLLDEYGSPVLEFGMSDGEALGGFQGYNVKVYFTDNMNTLVISTPWITPEVQVYLYTVEIMDENGNRIAYGERMINMFNTTKIEIPIQWTTDPSQAKISTIQVQATPIRT